MRVAFLVAGLVSLSACSAPKGGGAGAAGGGAVGDTGKAGGHAVSSAGSGGGGVGGQTSSCVYPPPPYGLGKGATVPPEISFMGFAPNGSEPTMISIQDLYDCDGTKGIHALIFDTAGYS